MPYVRCGKCVYKGKKCKTKGEKVGCSDSIEKAKKYLNKLRMETNENIMKITKNKLIQLIKEELEVILTNDEAEEMFGININKYSELLEADLTQTTPEGIPTLQRPSSIPTEKVPALQRPAKKDPREVLRMLIDFTEALEQRVEALEATINTPRE
tara:strand:+ start:2227 stop:2691 length:465 start_codon:yes stop_codon:yes gene_type:complete